MKLLWFFLLIGAAAAYPVWPDSEDSAILESEIQTGLGKYLKEILDQLLEQLEEKVGKDEHLRDMVKDVVTKLHQMGFNDALKAHVNKLTGRVREWFKRILDDLEHKERKSFRDSWQKVKDYFKDLGLHIREGLGRFGEWVKKHTGSSLDKAKSHLEHLRTIAEEYKKHVRFLRKEIQEEGLEFLRNYKEELGSLWEEAKQAFKEALDHQAHAAVTHPGYLERIKEYFRNLGLKIKDTYHKFGQWVKEHTKLDNVSGHLEKLRIIAQDFVDNARFLNKQVREQGLEFLRGYKEQLGKLWEDVKQAWKDSHDDVEEEQESVTDLWHRIKDYFQDRYHNFSEWVKQHFNSRRDKFISDIDDLKLVAAEYIDRIKFLGREVREEGLEFLKEYRHELGSLWEKAKEAFRESLKHEERRSLKDVWEKIKEYFKDLHIKIKEKYAKFGEWLKNHPIKKHVEDKVENLKNIAKKAIDHIKDLKEDVLKECHDFLEEHKKELGKTWDDFKVAFREAYDDLKKKKE